MINFIYDKQKESSIFEEHILRKKSPLVSKMISDELAEVCIDTSDKYILDQIAYVEKQWENASPKFLGALGDFYETTLPQPNLICYLTRLDIFPYKYNNSDSTDNWFSAPLFGNPAERNRVIMHELCHYFQPSPLAENIKEAVPVILNNHEQFGMYAVDRGHQNEEEQKWRKIIFELYQNGGKFKDLLAKVEETVV